MHNENATGVIAPLESQGPLPGVAAVATGSPRKRTLEIGALCDPISEQLKGLISEKDGKMLDADNEAITRCYLMGYMADALTARARKRLLSKCQEAVRRHAGANKD